MSKIFKITYTSKVECIDENHAYETLLDYLKDCFKNKDISAFEFEEVNNEKQKV